MFIPVASIKEGMIAKATKNCNGALEGQSYQIRLDSNNDYYIADGCGCANSWEIFPSKPKSESKSESKSELKFKSLIALGVLGLLGYTLMKREERKLK